MKEIEDFKESIVPGNYFLTKSMEFTRDRVSGTLWYLKKYLVLYYNIFLSDGVVNEEGINKIIKIFNDFINSMPEESQLDAKKFFFPDEVDISSNYNKFVNFKGNKMFANRSEEDDYMNNVRKYYFVYLMQIGGQSGVKKYIRENLYKEDFNMEKLDNIINDYLKLHPGKYNICQIKSDYHASLRNERQILWYYGFVHSKSMGSSDTEFSSLTPIGEAAIKASYDEFRLIWEHQKIKMISQPVTVLFSGIEENKYADGKKFSINYSQYVTILNYLYDKQAISKDEYQFIISRTKNNNMRNFKENKEKILQNVENIKQYVKLFDRKSDINSEDFDKELKKYVLGLRDDLDKDYNQNRFGVCSYCNGIRLNNKNRLKKILSVYNQIDKYKLSKYINLFNLCEKELEKKYTLQSKKIPYNINAKIKIDWDLYNIHIDKIIIISLILTEYSLKNDIDIENINIKNKDIKTIKNSYINLLECCGLSKDKDLTSILKMVSMALANKTLESIHFQEYIYEYTYINEYATLNISDLEKKIEKISKENIGVYQERTRSTKLINLMKSLYNSIYSDEQKLIKCECCGETTFLTTKDEAYLEYHHLLPFSIVDGPDHYINIYGICPDCHRKIHYGKDDLKEDLYAKFDKNNHLKKTILERFKYLYCEKVLKSYQLEYALAEHIINEEQYNQILT